MTEPLHEIAARHAGEADGPGLVALVALGWSIPAPT
jgi:hypothetical protein